MKTSLFTSIFQHETPIAATGLTFLMLLSCGLLGSAELPAKLIGDPFRTAFPNDNGNAPYARNIWDMQELDGVIYLGCGNSSNAGPPSAGNAASHLATPRGRVPVIQYSPKTKKFITYWEIPEEQIDVLRVLKGKLYTPGHDPTGADIGWLYNISDKIPLKASEITKKDGKKVSPTCMHLWDACEYNGILFTSAGSKSYASKDNGKTWSAVNFDLRAIVGTDRNFFAFPGFLATSNTIYAPNAKNPVYELFNTMGLHSAPPAGLALPDLYFVGLRREDIIPGDTPGRSSTQTIRRNIRVSPTQHLYILAQSHNDQQSLPVCVAEVTCATDNPADMRASLLELPGTTPPSRPFDASKHYSRPWDILLKEKGKVRYALILVEEKTSKETKGPVTMRVFRSGNNDFSQWSELFSFQVPTFARSFEYVDGVFYFGLGSETHVDVEQRAGLHEKGIHPDTGKVYAVQYDLFAAPRQAKKTKKSPSASSRQ